MGVRMHHGKLHRQLMPEPHWYLEMLGVDPAKQRFGLGAVLVRHGLARADRDNLPTYVETESAQNPAFYGRQGFQTFYTNPSEPGLPGVPTRCMLRRPRSS